MSVTLRAGDSINLSTGVVTRQDVKPELRRNDLRALATAIRSNTFQAQGMSSDV